MSIQDAYTKLLYQLVELYDDREAGSIADWVIEHVTGFRKIDRITNKQFPLSVVQITALQALSEQLLQHKPVQYVLQEAWFAGLLLYVDEQVLIPRPETEELVHWIVETIKKDTGEINKAVAKEDNHSKARKEKMSTAIKQVLDIGTGSGCIPIALKKKLPLLDMHACDISETALAVAKKNAAHHQADIRFYHADILDKSYGKQLDSFDIIVSNPPYIKQSEEKDMEGNVLLYEPHLALFVPDESPLLFYHAIADFGLSHLNYNGLLFFEINEALGTAVMELLNDKGYAGIELRKDMQGKDRMVMACLAG